MLRGRQGPRDREISSWGTLVTVLEEQRCSEETLVPVSSAVRVSGLEFPWRSVNVGEKGLPDGLPALEQAFALADESIKLYGQKVEWCSLESGRGAGGCQALVGSMFQSGRMF